MPSKRELIGIHAEALFLHDERGRMVSVNDVDRQTAPRLYLGRTAEGNIWRFRHNLAPDLVAELEAILADEPIATDLESPALTTERLYDALSRDAPVERIWEGPAWHFPEKIDQSSVVQVRQVTPDMEIAGDRFTWLADELEFWQPAFVVMDDGKVVSLCHSSRNTPLVAEAGVETLEGYRGRGYATAVATAWARAVRAEGREPLYSTSWDNHASRSLANRLGLILIGVDLHMT
ncbi:N/A [soil metagenome]